MIPCHFIQQWLHVVCLVWQKCTLFHFSSGHFIVKYFYPTFQKVQIDRLINLYRKCSDSRLHVPPQAGKAILWYNHFVDPETGWMGEMDNYTFHGGCPVTKGNKWIANFWIKTTDDKLDDLRRMKKLNQKNFQNDVKEELWNWCYVLIILIV